MNTQTIDPSGEASVENRVVHEVGGPALTPVQAGAAIGLGVVALLLSGAMPLLLGALAGEHRLTVAQIGDTAMVEALAMALTAALAGALLKPERLRLIGLAAVIALAAIDLAMVRATGLGVLALRALAGVPEGVLLWLTIGMIARSVMPERWAGVYYTALTGCQFLFTAGLAGWIVPRLHANGGFVVTALLVLICAPLAFLGCDRYARLPDGSTRAGSPPPRGLIALTGTLLFTAGAAAAAIYIVPLAHQAGLGSGVAGTAITASLAVQILGSAMATALAGRVHYFIVLVSSGLVTLASWSVFMFWPPAWLFIVASMAIGFVGLLAAPFQVPMLIEADPTRRAAVQAGGVSLLGGALGPFLASRVVGEHDVHPVLVLAAVLLIAGLSIFGGLHLTARAGARVAAEA